jgi:ADP-heptose:LPS heptosyltransferase
MVNIINVNDIITENNDNKYIFIILLECLGDIIACEPIINYLHNKNPLKKIVWVLKEEYYEALIGHKQLDFILFLDNLSRIDYFSKKMINNSHLIYNLHFSYKLCTKTNIIVRNNNNNLLNTYNYLNFGSLLESFCVSAFLPKLCSPPQFHILQHIYPPKLPNKYVVFHCSSNNPAKNWTAKAWNELALFFMKRNWSVVEIGFTPVLDENKLDLTKYFNLTTERHIQIIASIIQQSNFFVGIDSSFAHLANALNINGLIILGSLGNFNKYNPFTGLYANETHLINSKGKIAKYITSCSVITRIKSLITL